MVENVWRRPAVRLTAKTLGFVVGGILGAALVGLVGYRAFVLPTDGLVEGLFFIAGFIAVLFSLLSPIALVEFFRARLATKASRQVVRAVGYLVNFAFFFGVALVGVRYLDGLGIDTAWEMMTVFAAITGLVFGAITGFVAAERAVDYLGYPTGEGIGEREAGRGDPDREEDEGAPRGSDRAHRYRE